MEIWFSANTINDAGMLSDHSSLIAYPTVHSPATDDLLNSPGSTGNSAKLPELLNLAKKLNYLETLSVDWVSYWRSLFYTVFLIMSLQRIILRDIYFKICFCTYLSCSR
jgi:hypothetical protein